MSVYAVSFVIVVMIVFIVILSYLYASAKIDLEELTNEIIKLNAEIESPESSNIRIEYSQSMLEYIREFTMRVASINFRNFMDGHELSKVTKATVSNLVEVTATKVNNSIDLSNINFNDLLFTKEFYNSYIIEISMISIKELLDRAVNNIEEV